MRTLLILVLLFIVGCSAIPQPQIYANKEQTQQSIQGNIQGALDAQGSAAWAVAGLALGGIGPIAAAVWPVSSDDLVGKPVEYVQSYQQSYRVKKRNENIKYAAYGWALWAVIYLVYAADAS